MREYLEVHKGDRELAQQDFNKLGIENWPPWGCECHAYVHKETREGTMEMNSVLSVFFGFEDAVTSGVRVGILAEGFELLPNPILEVKVATTTKCSLSAMALMRSLVWAVQRCVPSSAQCVKRPSQPPAKTSWSSVR